MHKIIKINFRDPLYKEVLNLRYEVLRKPLGMVINEAEIEHDRHVIYFAYVKYDEIQGVVGLDLSQSSAGKIIQMAVSEYAQSSGIGKELISEVEKYCLENGVFEVYLDARYTAQGFYNKLGYKEYGGVYEKIGIPHILMRKSLAENA